MESTKNINKKILDIEFEKYKKLIEQLDSQSNTENKNKSILLQNESKYIKFKEWLKNNGAIYEKNFEYPTSYGKFNTVGLKSKINISQNEALLYIPRHLIIDSNKLRKTEEFISIFSYPELKELEKLNVLIITIFLLKEYTKVLKNKSSLFKEYIDLIDSESLIFWEEELLQQLDEPNTIEAMKEHSNDLFHYYTKLKQYSIINIDIINFDKFALYYSFVLSRNFYVNDNQLLLVPLADALNHKHVRVKYEIFDSFNLVCKHTLYFDDSIIGKRLKRTDNSLFYSSIQLDLKDQNKLDENYDRNNNKDYLEIFPQDYFIISTNNQEYKQGEQVFNFYGEHSNEYLLKWYGFCYLNNIYDYVTISLHLPKYEDYEFDKYLQIFFEKNLTETNKNGQVFNTLNFDVRSGRINLKLLKYVRFFYFYENDCVNKFINFQFDINIEIEVLKRTIELLEISYENKSKKYRIEDDLKKLKNIYDEYDKNFEKDFEFLKKMRINNILIFRISQKMNLLYQIEICKSNLKIFSNKLKFESKHLKNNKNTLETNFNEIEEKYDISNDPYFIENKKKVYKYFRNLKLL